MNASSSKAAGLVRAARTPQQLALEPSVMCPHCWHASAPQSLLWIAEHQELLGDSVLGPEVAMRFKPTRFSIDCKAIDARGMSCSRLACPRCHLHIPRQLVDCQPLFVSIIGVPASGKSYFLTSLTWQLRQQLPARFAASFTDADPAGNQSLLDYEQTLFMADDPTRVVALAKTQEQGGMYETVQLGDHPMQLPKPFMFFLKPTEQHPNAHSNDAARKLHRVVCLYDNAGESYQPGKESSLSPVTQHLGKASLLLFLFDPTKDTRFRARLGGLPAESSRDSKVERQEIVLLEAAARIRRQVGLVDGSRHKRPLIVVLPKLDVWERLLPEPVGAEPLLKHAVAGGMDAVDLARVERVSQQARALLASLCPELVAAAESFCEEVTYVPVSAVGGPPTTDPATGLSGFRPADVCPRWVTVPVLYGLSKITRGLIAGGKAKPKAQSAMAGSDRTKHAGPVAEVRS